MTGSISKSSTTRAGMHVVMLLMAPTLPLPETTKGGPPFSCVESPVDPFAVGIVLVVPCVEGWALDDQHAVFSPPETYSAHWEDCGEGREVSP